MATFARLLLYAGVLFVIGELCLDHVNRRGWLARPEPARRRVTLMPWLAILTALVLLFAAQFLALELAPTVSDVALLVRETVWGQGWMWLAMLAVVGPLAAVARAPWVMRAAIALALAVALGGLGHAAADDAPVVGRTLDALHVLGMAAWIGTLATVAVARGSLGAPHDLDAWSRFSALATIAAPLTVITGVSAAFRRVGLATIPQIAASDYGRLLGLKSALVLVILLVGAWHRRAVRRGDVPVVLGVRVEVALAMLVLGLTALLTGTAPPGE